MYPKHLLAAALALAAVASAAPIATPGLKPEAVSARALDAPDASPPEPDRVLVRDEVSDVEEPERVLVRDVVSDVDEPERVL
ncbi:hypothetical protein MMC17_003193 [Xylographa soralifera]|nr:hypothetical protein [Xylographa soralifera]